MSKSKNNDNSLYDILFGHKSQDQIKEMLGLIEGNRDNGIAEYPYSEEHPTLQVRSIEPKAYHLYISLQGSPVKIFRRITVPSNIRMEHLAEIIIRAMGWGNEHLHQFIAHGEEYVSVREIKEGGGIFSFRMKHDAMACTIGDVLKEKGKQIKFEYDFGDSWMHNVRLSAIEAYDPRHVVSVDSGSGPCPPEDCGGVYGYAEMLENGEISLGRFNLSSAKESVDAYVSSVIANEKDFDEPKPEVNKKRNAKGAKVVRMIPYTFSIADIRRMHPRDLKPSPTDQEYALLANKLERSLVNDASNDFYEAKYMKAILSRVIMYYEDIIADSGMWRGFVNKNLELYGKPLPFYPIEGDYYPDEPHKEDVQLLVWDAMRDVRPLDKVANPENPAIENAAEVIYKILDEEFENVGINENLTEYFSKAAFASDFYEMRDVLKWIFFDCYLTTNAYAEDLLNGIREDLNPFFKGKDGAYEAECIAPMVTQVGMLALLPKDWLSLFIAAKCNKAVAKKITELETTEDVDVIKMTSHDAKKISFVDLKDRKITIGRGYRYDIAESDFDKDNGAIGSYVKYDGKWYLNGNQSWGFIDKVLDEMKEQQKPFENLSVKQYDHLMELSGGSPFFYFKNMTQMRKFLTEEAGWKKTDMKGLGQLSGAKNITLFLQGHDKPLAITPNVAESICDKRNPCYKPGDKSLYGLTMLMDGGVVPGVLVRYLISHNMLPDAGLNSLKGAEHGRRLVQDNIDFLARALRRADY